ncbi:Zinc finger CCCH domain-containing protein 18 [Triticum urartu]|uniref:Zinc finger CCCH domain-containing protein 18 n=1 Tax=Triticum urartu TaxID=4572 RepID=M7Z249_TRIUA|nr:Zinc finger CCCH domain-containing protein 18 [Triticum urartu]
MSGEGEEDEAAEIELQLEQHLEEQRSSLAAVDEALAADATNADLLEVHGELLSAIKDAEEGLLHLKRSRLVKQIDEIFPNQESASLSTEAAIEPLDPNDVEPEPLEPQEFSVGSKCRFRHNDGRWYNGCILGLEGSGNARVSFLTPTSEKMSPCYLVTTRVNPLHADMVGIGNYVAVAHQPVGNYLVTLYNTQNKDHYSYQTSNISLPIVQMCKFFLQQRCRFANNCRLSHGVVIPTSSLKQFTPTAWRQSLAGSSILAASGHHSGLWRRAELESWDDELKHGQVVFQDDGSTATLPGDSLSIPEYVDVSGEDDKRGSSEDESELSEDGDQEDESIHQGLGRLETTNLTGVQSETVIFAKWEQHTRGVASKMMAKMGYREGMGLGVSGQGMLDPIPVKVLPPKQSLDHAVTTTTGEDGRSIHRTKDKKRSRGGQRKRDRKFAELARAAKAEEAERSVFSFMNSQLVSQDASEGSSASKARKESPSGQANGHPKKEDNRRSLLAYDDEVKELRSQVGRLEEMVQRNRKDKAVHDAASRKLEQTRKALADAEATHASATNAVSRKEKEKKWLKF